jgi:hypothetical protein
VRARSSPTSFQAARHADGTSTVDERDHEQRDAVDADARS